jgi:peptidoglycan/LPS O-acetylase OafA/YrhL
MKYRDELDGLRACAVIPIILSHAGFSTFSGGFIGVDVFFVLSGYLITSIILTQIAENRFSLLHFYERRIRRIIPAQLFVMLICMPFAWMWLLPAELSNFAQSAVAAATFTSNLFFWSTFNYFSEAAHLVPLLHTWSLAIEEQFYILFPPALLLCWRFGKSPLLLALICVFILSFILSSWAAYYHPISSFYLLPARAWELLLGVLVAFYLHPKPSPPYRLITCQWLSLIGGCLIIIPILTFDAQTPFPGIAALLPTLGAACIILFAVEGTWLHRILSYRWFSGIGLISYSAYLWHQPLFAFVHHSSVAYGYQEPPMMILCLAVFPLAYCSWRFIETPFRNAHYISRRTIGISAGSVTAGLIAIGVITSSYDGFERYYLQHRYKNLDQRYYSYVDYGLRELMLKQYKEGTCFITSRFGFKYFQSDACLRQPTDKPTLLVIGDSHAVHLVPMLSRHLDIPVQQATASGCMPIIPLDGLPRCTDLMRYVFEEFLPANPVDTLILSARWRNVDISSLQQTAHHLARYARQVIVLGPTLEYTADLPLLLMKNPDLSRGVPRTSPYIWQDSFRLNSMMQQALSNIPNVHYVDLLDIFCDSNQCHTTLPDRTPIVRDRAHYTTKGAEYVIRYLPLSRDTFR